MATKVKPSRLQVSWTAQVWQVPVYVDEDTFQWWAWWGGWASFWRFLSLWDSTTWMPISFPEATPYTYITWDYFIVEIVSSATPPVNYKPDGSTYSGAASSVTESDEVEVWDTYVYDGQTWLLQSNHWKTVTFANIAWDPYDNTNLSNALWLKANDNTVVKLTWNQSIAWTKTFSTSPVVPSKTTAATNTWTAIATEAQVYAKQDKLTVQTAYTSKWTSTKVPTITTNTLWQVTAITETNIAFPVTSVNWGTWAVVLDADDISDSTTTNKFVTQTDKDAWDWKQDELESWVNIRTINWTSILGSWNIDTPTGIPSQTWEAGKFLTTDWTSVSWGVPTGWIAVDSASPIQLTKIWAGTQAQYEALGSYDATTVYLTI